MFRSGNFCVPRDLTLWLRSLRPQAARMPPVPLTIDKRPHHLCVPDGYPLTRHYESDVTWEETRVADDPVGDALKALQYGLVVVGSRSADGELNGMTANWLTQVSFDPRVVAVAIQETAHTRQNIDATGVFAISALPKGSTDLSLKFTKKSTSGEGRLEGEPVSTHETGTPVLDAAVAWFECRVVGQAKPGDHVVYFGEVIGGEARGAEATTLAETGMSYAG
jgi:flavin reductase (DIM6/NTAB) family NADH-FMN oxidoreductase RutF